MVQATAMQRRVCVLQSSCRRNHMLFLTIAHLQAPLMLPFPSHGRPHTSLQRPAQMKFSPKRKWSAPVLQSGFSGPTATAVNLKMEEVKAVPSNHPAPKRLQLKFLHVFGASTQQADLETCLRHMAHSGAFDLQFLPVNIRMFDDVLQEHLWNQIFAVILQGRWTVFLRPDSKTFSRVRFQWKLMTLKPL